MAAPSSAGTVLLVEDEPEMRRLIVKILAMHGYRVLEAHDGGQALALCREHQDPIHLLLADVVIPDTNGPALAASIQTLRPEIRVLYISAYDTELLRQNFGLSAQAPFLQKPFGVEDLLKKVHAALQGQR